ncbi:ParB/Srx family N-terminal domain-containing protein [Rhodohalobacter sp. 614A]|uniref:ParB/Srx family N-terminal domain-containing protein n=1 Tax=Rhodohalobacter sp. 614A TaxID=2908649 RepID=UPI001F2A6292|nr:ParB/Srx family N-terminal domain-containing protein [Rhodohalobacter sp. 614A]
MGHEYRSIAIEKLGLDFLNPRYEEAENQRDALQKMLSNQKKKLVNLAESIIENGLNPSDIPIIINGKGDGYTVLEGNRRITALILLSQPQIVDLISDSSLKKSFKKLHNLFLDNPIKEVQCVFFEKRDEANIWIDQKHSGEQDGVGIVKWGAKEKARFQERSGKIDARLYAIELVKHFGNLNDEEKSKINNIAITTLSRILSDSSIKENIGVGIIGDKLVARTGIENFILPLKKIVLDLAERKINVTDVYYSGDREGYLHTFNKEILPDRIDLKSNFEEVSIEIAKEDVEEDSDIFDEEQETEDPQKRWNLIPKALEWHISNKRAQQIFIELKKLNLKAYKNSISVTLRVFLEISMDHFIDENKMLTVYKNEKFKNKVHKIADYMEEEKMLNKDQLKAARNAASSQHHLFSVDTFHNYVHNRYLIPSPDELVITWDNMELFVKKLWGIK